MLLANIIRIFHIIVTLFIIITPFVISDFLILLLHVVSCLSLLIHWYTNNSICSLTLLESKLRGIPLEHSFIYSFIAPVYQFLNLEMISENNLTSFIYISIIFLLSVSLYKIYDKYKNKFN